MAPKHYDNMREAPLSEYITVDTARLVPEPLRNISGGYSEIPLEIQLQSKTAEKLSFYVPWDGVLDGFIKGKEALRQKLGLTLPIQSATIGQALEKSGFKGEEKNRLSPEKYMYMFETHIEQGPILEDNGKDIGVVDCVLGMFNYRVRFYGQTVHAGTFPMPKRRDAFFAAAKALCYLHEEIDKLGVPDLVYTTGEVVCHPCVHTCVPDYFDFSIDARHENPDILKKVLDIVLSCADKEWAGCRCEVVKAWNRDTVYWDKKLVSYVKKSAEELGIKHMYIHSGAGHDAQFAAYMLPTTMIFVQSKDGLSHCEPEFSSVEHCTEGASVMLNAVLMADTNE